MVLRGANLNTYFRQAERRKRERESDGIRGAVGAQHRRVFLAVGFNDLYMSLWSWSYGGPFALLSTFGSIT